MCADTEWFTMRHHCPMQAATTAEEQLLVLDRPIRQKEQQEPEPRVEVHPNDQWELEPRVEELESMVEVQPKEQ
jgi:hypothetical protein